MSGINKGEKVFIDTNFFIALLVRQHEHNALATQKMLMLEEKECELYTSSFVFYELFKKICEFHNDNNGNKPLIRKLNKLIRSINLKFIDVGLENASFQDIIRKLDEAKDIIVNTDRMNIVSLDSVHIQGCLDCIRMHNTKPGDSFIAATINEIGITHIATFDKGFKRFNFVYI